MLSIAVVAEGKFMAQPVGITDLDVRNETFWAIQSASEADYPFPSFHRDLLRGREPFLFSTPPVSALLDLSSRTLLLLAV
jgi:hypothetical protein